MIRYLFRRLLQAVPTVLGVLLVTFVLFHVVGGSPAALVLGQNASAEALAEFDAARGYDKPLFFGNWTSTRALEPVDFSTAPASVRARWNAPESGDFLLSPSAPLEVPYAFDLPANASWRLSVRGHEPGGRSFSTNLFFSSDAVPTFAAPPSGLVLESVSLSRRTRHFFDSQLLDFLLRVARLDLGRSSSLNRPVTALLREGIGPSLSLTVPILFVELAVSLSLALLCAYRRGEWLDRSLVAVCVALMSVNYLVWIVAGQFLLAFKLGWFPVWGYESVRSLFLPVLIGAATGIGANVRFYRTLLLEEMNKDYVRTAFAKGLPASRVLFVHVLKNALGPVIVNVALALPYLYTGSLLLEGFFGIPGLGYLSLNAIHSADVDVIRGIVLVGALLFTLANLLADLALAWVDPRVRLA